MLYFIQAKKTGLIKIGFSTNPKDRCSILKSFNADKLRILKIIEAIVEENMIYIKDLENTDIIMNGDRKSVV